MKWQCCLDLCPPFVHDKELEIFVLHSQEPLAHQHDSTDARDFLAAQKVL